MYGCSIANNVLQYAKLAKTCQHEAPPLVISDPLVSTAQKADSVDWSAHIATGRKIKIYNALEASGALRRGMNTPKLNGVSIHSGPSADRPSRAASSNNMPSISESPLEQDFTVSGTPSKLECPFASMANRRLSAHTRSVVSRYRPEGVASPPLISPSKIRRTSSSARGSLPDPIAAEICGLSNTQVPDVEAEVPASVQGSTAASAGVCPIRFLDQHSPEEVAAYFESHKHELPRSHEICVKRYQSNEASIRQLDAKYGNLVSMIQGLGHKHVSLLPDKLGGGEMEMQEDQQSNEKVERWAKTVSGAADIDDEEEEDDEKEEEERLPHFDRPLNDVRLGESPSRPWGIRVPAEARRRNSDASSVAAAPSPHLSGGDPTPPSELTPEAKPQEGMPPESTRPDKPAGRCPFGFDGMGPKPASAMPEAPKPVSDAKPDTKSEDVAAPSKCPFDHTAKGHKPRVDEPTNARVPEPKPIRSMPNPVFVAPDAKLPNGADVAGQLQSQMVFTGPVFIGYSVDQAIQILQAGGGSRNQATN